MWPPLSHINTASNKVIFPLLKYMTLLFTTGVFFIVMLHSISPQCIIIIENISVEFSPVSSPVLCQHFIISLSQLAGPEGAPTSVAGEEAAQPFLPSIIRIMRDLL